VKNTDAPALDHLRLEAALQLLERAGHALPEGSA